MANFPPPPPPDKNLGNPFYSSESQVSGSDDDKTNSSRQTSSTRQSGQTNQRSWAAANPKSPRLHSKPSNRSLNSAPSELPASATNKQQQNHTQPLLTPRGGTLNPQQASALPADPLSAPSSFGGPHAVTVTTALMNSASPVYTKTVKSTATSTTASSDATTASDGSQSTVKNPAKEHRLKKTDKKAAAYEKQNAGSSVDGADLSPKDMAKFLRRAVTEDGKFNATQNTMKTFMRAGFGKVDGQSAQTCFAQFLRPTAGSSDLHKLYNKMAFDLLEVRRGASGEETSTIKMLDNICAREDVNPTNITSNASVGALVEPVIKPLFDYLNDVGDSVANSRLPGKLLEFLIEFDRELVRWQRETEAKQQTLKQEGGANADAALSKEDWMTIRRNAQIAMLGVKGVDGYLGTEVFKRLEELGFHSVTNTGGVLKNFNSYLSRIYSKKCDALIKSVLSATDKDLALIRERRAADEKEARGKKAEQKFSSLKEKAETKIDQSSYKKTGLRDGRESADESSHTPRSESELSATDPVLSGKRLHELEEVNESLTNVFLDKYPSLNDFKGIVSRMLKVIDAQYTRPGKSPSEKALKKIAVDSIQQELDTVADKISIIQDSAALDAQKAVYAKLDSLMGRILLASAHNPFDE